MRNKVSTSFSMCIKSNIFSCWSHIMASFSLHNFNIVPHTKNFTHSLHSIKIHLYTFKAWCECLSNESHKQIKLLCYSNFFTIYWSCFNTICCWFIKKYWDKLCWHQEDPFQFNNITCCILTFLICKGNTIVLPYWFLSTARCRTFYLLHWQDNLDPVYLSD